MIHTRVVNGLDGDLWMRVFLVEINGDAIVEPKAGKLPDFQGFRRAAPGNLSASCVSLPHDQSRELAAKQSEMVTSVTIRRTGVFIAETSF